MSLRLTIILTVLKCPSLPCGIKKYDDAMFILCRRFFKVCQTGGLSIYSSQPPMRRTYLHCRPLLQDIDVFCLIYSSILY